MEIFFRGLVDTAATQVDLNGSLPAELGDLTELQRLDLRENQLTGEIPASIGKLSNLEVLNLGSNQLTGEIPPTLGNLKKLRELWLGYNQLTGGMPDSLGNLTNLEILGLRSNLLTGSILASLGNLVNLRYLSLNDNRLTGEIPSSLGGLTNLEALWLQNNELIGEVPISLGNLAKLASVELKDNRITGCLPPAWEVVLEQDFDEAGLGFYHDPTPPTCSSGIAVTEPGDNLALVKDCKILLELWERLSEERPRNWNPYVPIAVWTGVTVGGTPGRVHELELGSRVAGTVPAAIGGLTALEVLDFYGSRLTGEIPYSLARIHRRTPMDGVRKAEGG